MHGLHGAVTGQGKLRCLEGYFSVSQSCKQHLLGVFPALPQGIVNFHNLDAEIPDEEVGTVAASIAPVAAEPSPSVTGPPEQQSPGELDLLKKLLELLLSFPNRSLAIGVATKALNILQSGKEVCTGSILIQRQSRRGVPVCAHQKAPCI